MLINNYNAISNSRLYLISEIKEMCSRCAQRKLVTNNESEKTFCFKCKFVITKKLQETVPEWKSFIQRENGNKAKAGALTSLTIHEYISN